MAVDDGSAAPTPLPAARTRAVAVGYAAALVLTVVAILALRRAGTGLVAHGTPAVTTAGAAPDVLGLVLRSIAIVVVVARFVGRAFERWLGQPAVSGEIVAGLLLGPSVLGAVWPAAQAFVLPAAAAPHLGMVAKLGVVLFMFLVGLELDPGVLRGRAHTTLAVAHASMLVPFLAGAALALGLFGRYGVPGTSFTVFSLFLGVSMAVTAFPVLARILAARGWSSTPLGATALACAAVGDASAWVLLAFVSGVARSALGAAARTALLVVAHGLAVALVARPLVERLAAREERREGPVSPTVLAVVFGGMLLSAVATEAIGIHALFGAFVFGALVPHDGRLAAQIRSRTEDLVVVLLLPVFFAFTGMRTHVGLVSTGADLAWFAAIVGVASFGKIAGTFGAARLLGVPRREAGILGVLMNTRGLMELVVLDVGLEMGVLSPTLFTMLVGMAVLTTLTTPVFLSRVREPALRSTTAG